MLLNAFAAAAVAVSVCASTLKDASEYQPTHLDVLEINEDNISLNNYYDSYYNTTSYYGKNIDWLWILIVLVCLPICYCLKHCRNKHHHDEHHHHHDDHYVNQTGVYTV